MAIDLSSPRIGGTFEEIQLGGSTNWMLLGPLPALPGQSNAKETIGYEGKDGISEFKTTLSAVAHNVAWGVMREKGTVLLVEFISNDVQKMMTASKRANYVAIGKQIAASFAHTHELSISSPTELTDSAIGEALSARPSRKPSALNTASSKRASVDPDSESPTTPTPGKFAASSTSSLSLASSAGLGSYDRLTESDADLVASQAEESLRRQEELREKKRKTREASELRMRIFEEEQSREMRWQNEWKSTEQKLIAEHKRILGSAQAPPMGHWLNQLTPDGRFWKRRWVTPEGHSLRIFKDSNARQPIQVIDLRSPVSIQNAKENYYFVNSFTLSASDGEHTFLADERSWYIHSIAVIEKASGK
ncbi:hypothetical protein HK104_010033 [Borealophlyctis nickersoniae]|nr:hypothetical protein HK104_010033 [Borealophlyctis nickersoniae]